MHRNKIYSQEHKLTVNEIDQLMFYQLANNFMPLFHVQFPEKSNYLLEHALMQ